MFQYFSLQGPILSQLASLFLSYGVVNFKLSNILQTSAYDHNVQGTDYPKLGYGVVNFKLSNISQTNAYDHNVQGTDYPKLLSMYFYCTCALNNSSLCPYSEPYIYRMHYN